MRKIYLYIFLINSFNLKVLSQLYINNKPNIRYQYIQKNILFNSLTIFKNNKEE